MPSYQTLPSGSSRRPVGTSERGGSPARARKLAADLVDVADQAPAGTLPPDVLRAVEAVRAWSA